MLHLTHFPKPAVRYPAAAILVAMPVMLRGIAAKPDTGSSALLIEGSAFSGLTWKGFLPDCRADRVGEQYLSVSFLLLHQWRY